MKKIVLAVAFTASGVACVTTTDLATMSGGASGAVTGATTGPGASVSSSSSGGGGASYCGGKQGFTCAADEWCDYETSVCGNADNVGTCKPRPGGCTADCPGVCGCDGKFYCNECDANSAGFDVTGDMSCMPTTCDQKSAAINTQIGGKACTTVVRLDPSLTFLGYRFFCGAPKPTDEMQAIAQVLADTGLATSTLLSGPNPPDEYLLVAYLQANDIHAAASARTGMSLFAAMDYAPIKFPATWLPPDDLGPGCIPKVNAGPPQHRGLVAPMDMPLTPPEIDPVIAAVWQSALPDGMLLEGYALDAFVLERPDEQGNPEWIVMMNSGMLD